MYIGINNIMSNLFLNRKVVIEASKSNITEEYKLFFFLCKKNQFSCVFFFRYPTKSFEALPL